MDITQLTTNYASQTATTADSKATLSLSDLGEDYTRFLTMLTAQIQYQDPLEPMDSTQFVSQLAQLSQVEQAVQTNSNLESLSVQVATLAELSGANMIGREVTVASDKVVLEDGETQSYFQLAYAATAVSAEIRDPLDRVVRTMSGLSGEAGESIALDWDGLDDSGNPQLDGAYTFTITATDDTGAAVQSFTFRKTEVQNLFFTDGDHLYGLDADEMVTKSGILSAG